MTKPTEHLETVVMTRLLRLNAALHGVVTGLLLGLGIFVATNWLVLKGGPVVGPHLALLGQFFIGYRVTLLGSLIGFAYGFAGLVDGLNRRIADALGEAATFIATGGLAGTIAPHCETIDEIDELLTLRGLQLIYDRNSPT